MSSETVLHGGDINLVVRIGDTVRRPLGPWSPAVHALLQHFEAVGFDDLLDDVMERRRLGYEAHRVWGGSERRRGWAEMWDDGSGRRILGNIAWVEEHRQELDAWLN